MKHIIKQHNSKELPEKPSEALLKHLKFQLSSSSPLKLSEDPLAELLSTYKPRDAVEAMLLTQMTAVHNLGMVALLRAGIETRSGSPENFKNSTNVHKLINLFTRQIDALLNYRGKLSTQKIVVEQVNVEQGGKAIVGNIAKGGSND